MTPNSSTRRRQGEPNISAEEIAAIRELVPQIGICATAERLDRDKSGISRHAKRLGVKSPFNAWKDSAPEPPPEPAKHSQRLAQEKVDQVIAMSRSGMRSTRIAHAVGLARSTVNKIRAKHGLVRKEPEAPKVEVTVKPAVVKAERVETLLAALERVYGVRRRPAHEASAAAEYPPMLRRTTRAEVVA